MELFHCPECGATLSAGGGSAPRCPECGALLNAPARGSDLVIDVAARAEDGTPAGAPVEPEVTASRPTVEQRNFSGRVFPGGPFFQGKTIVFRTGGPGEADGRGCCGCGCLIFGVLVFLLLRGVGTLFQ